MKTTFRAAGSRAWIIVPAALILAAFATDTFANDGKITFIDDAKKAGRVGVTIDYKSPSDRCTVVGSVYHPNGTSSKDKAKQLADDINAQCVNVTATVDPPNSGTVKVSSVGDKEITEITVYDNTSQMVTDNPGSLHDGSINCSVHIEGIGSDPAAMAYISMDGCGSSASFPTFGHTGAEVAQGLATSLVNCDPGARIEYVSLGGGAGEIRFLGLSSANSIITFDPADTSLTDIMTMGVEQHVPSATGRTLIVLTLLLITVGILTIRRGIRSGRAV
jgi:hypothetical protein